MSNREHLSYTIKSIINSNDPVKLLKKYTDIDTDLIKNAQRMLSIVDFEYYSMYSCDTYIDKMISLVESLKTLVSDVPDTEVIDVLRNKVNGPEAYLDELRERIEDSQRDIDESHQNIEMDRVYNPFKGLEPDSDYGIDREYNERAKLIKEYEEKSGRSYYDSD